MSLPSIWVLATLGLLIVCCWVFLMWSSDHCSACAWLSNVPYLVFFWKTCQKKPSSSSVITSNYTKAWLLASWHQRSYMPQAWGCYTPETAACWWGVFPAFAMVVSVPDPFLCAAFSDQQLCREHEAQWWVCKGTHWLPQNPCKGLLRGGPFADSKVTGPC